MAKESSNKSSDREKSSAKKKVSYEDKLVETPPIKTPIDASWTISHIFSEFPQYNQKLAQAMTQMGLACVGCSASSWETLEAGMLGHGKSPQEIETLVANLNKIVTEPIDTSTITISPFAAQKFREYACKEGKEGWGLRFYDKAGGCGGFEYMLDFQEKADDDDEIFESEGIEIYVKKSSLGRLLGAVIDFQDGLYGAGFKISNPNAKSSCSCGTSHNY